MCGIGGILRRDGGEIPDDWINTLDARIAHRGPDGHGVFRDSTTVQTPDGPQRYAIALVHRRLSIIDHDGGQQPMVSPNGRHEDEGLVAVVFNGCIYNHRELRTELQHAGHEFQTDHSDTEVLIHAWREWGPGFEEHLDGMYAFALWDHDQGRLVLARDMFGEKPLYVRWSLPNTDSALAFCSDAAALAALGPLHVEPAAQARWLEHYFQLGDNHRGATVFGGFDDNEPPEPQLLHQVPPPITADADEMIPHKPRTEVTQAEFERLLDNAVRERLEADVPLGCFLSGGVDSSIIAALARNHVDRLMTFTIRMPDATYDESEYAAQVASHLDTEHHVEDVASDPAADLVMLIKRLGQPFGDSSILPTYWVSKAARNVVTVALSGDGADELFFGYDRYHAARRMHRHRRVLRWIPDRYGVTAHPKSRKHKLGRVGQMARDYPALGIASMESLFNQRAITELLPSREGCGAEQRPGFDPMLNLRRFDLQHYLPDDILCKVDTASMAVALEVRAPFLDRDVVQAALHAPTWNLCTRGKRKGMLCDIAANYVPRAVIDRPKMGFAIPIGSWFSDTQHSMSKLIHDMFDKADPFPGLPVNANAARAMLDTHKNKTCDHSQRLFALLTLSIWANHVRPSW